MCIKIKKVTEHNMWLWFNDYMFLCTYTKVGLIILGINISFWTKQPSRIVFKLEEFVLARGHYNTTHPPPTTRPVASLTHQFIGRICQLQSQICVDIVFPYFTNVPAPSRLAASLSSLFSGRIYHLSMRSVFIYFFLHIHKRLFSYYQVKTPKALGKIKLSNYFTKTQLTYQKCWRMANR